MTNNPKNSTSDNNDLDLSLTSKKNTPATPRKAAPPSISGELYVPPSGPPQVASPSAEIYAIMGEANIFRMLEDLYLELEKSSIRPMFPPNMVAASKKSAAFFVGLLGGPPLYHQKYGPPMMRARHLPFAIDEQARQVWLSCFDTVLKDASSTYSFPEEHIAGFRLFLQEFSKWMVNRKS